MADRAFRALVRVELQRLRGHVARGAGFTLAALALFALLGRGDRETFASVLLGTSVYYVLWPPLSAIVDRLEGGLELLSGLPIRPDVVARARLTGIAAAVLPIGLQVVVAFGLFVGPTLGVDPSPGTLAGVFACSWAAAVGLGGIGAGAILLWGVDAAGRWPVLVTGLTLLLVVVLGERYGAALGAATSALVARGGTLWALGALGAMGALAGVGLAYGLIRRGVAEFRPERGRLRG